MINSKITIRGYYKDIPHTHPDGLLIVNIYFVKDFDSDENAIRFFSNIKTIEDVLAINQEKLKGATRYSLELETYEYQSICKIIGQPFNYPRGLLTIPSNLKKLE